jgi:hypothetical protein
MPRNKKKGALLATVSAGALAAALVFASSAGAAGVKAAGPRCTARDGGTCTLRPGASGGAIAFVAHDRGGFAWTISDETAHTVLQSGNSSASGTLTNANTSGWAAGDDIVLSISGKGSIKATWKAAVRRA